MSSIKKIKGIVERIIRRNCLGIIYNCPKNDQAIIVGTILEKFNNIQIKGSDAYTSRMLQDRLGKNLNIKNFSWCQLPAIEGRLLTIHEADAIKSSYDKVLKDLYKNKVPVLLLMNGGNGMENIRKFKSYYSVLTIEQDYKKL